MRKKIAIIFLLSFILLSNDVWAYLDAGTGSYILQLIVGIFFGAVFVVKLLWGKIVTFFKKTFSSK
ncbi:hypothetical protein C4544_02070 [candidate division WS5 bacterium]|uniref:Uncharacterized protein n=1 Tax=candidate division WS5 bacterium TaxID=2093353 RepID=A0A419DEX8_9BACT|nr:MAG: hypothetical protein C4544_02070 [candidate division WS5 bacterium]